MNISALLPVIAALACPIAMGLTMWFMSRNKGDQPQGKRNPLNATERLNLLREERRTLEAEIAEAERIVELETQREALLNVQNSPLDTSLT